MQKILSRLSDEGLEHFHHVTDEADSIVVFAHHEASQQLKCFAAGTCPREELRSMIAGAACHTQFRAGTDPALLAVATRLDSALNMLEAHTDCSMCGHVCQTHFPKVHDQ